MLTYNRSVRTLAIRGQITCLNGAVIELTEADVILYRINSGIGSEGLPLGSTEASAYTLEIDNVGKKYKPSDLDGADVYMEVGILTDGAFVFSDFGVWIVDYVDASEQSVSITVSGYDALASQFADEYIDSPEVYPTTIGSLATAVCAAAGVTLRSHSFPNAAVQIATMPEWAEGTTLRDVISYCAVCAGGFARIARTGELEIVGYSDVNVYELDPHLYKGFTQQGGSPFKFNSLEVILDKDSEDYTRFAIDESIADNATNTIQVGYNPLLTQGIMNSVAAELSGLSISPGAVTWGGDPIVTVGDCIEVTLLTAEKVKLMVTNQEITFSGGLNAVETCTLPSLNTVNSGTYSTGNSVFDSNGNVRATRVAGLDRSVVSATIGHFEKLDATTIEADALTAGIVSALKLTAESISTGSITTDNLTAVIATIMEATIGKISAGTINTNELYAAFANLINLAAENIKAGSIQTDQLAAALANFVSLTAATADFDLATIQNLLSNALVLEKGVAEKMMITNLVVTSANMLSAVIDKLVVKGENGQYYRVSVGSDGLVSTEVIEVSDEEIAAGTTGNGQQIVESTINVQDLNAQYIAASEGVINKLLTEALTAGKITAGEALIASATIPALYTTSINAMGETMDLTANSTIQLLIGTNELIRAWYTFTEDGMRVGKAGSTYSTLTDDTGFHVLQLGEKIGSFAKRQLAAETVRVGRVDTPDSRIVLREAPDGGLAILPEVIS